MASTRRNHLASHRVAHVLLSTSLRYLFVFLCGFIVSSLLIATTSKTSSFDCSSDEKITALLHHPKEQDHGIQKSLTNYKIQQPAAVTERKTPAGFIHPGGKLVGAFEHTDYGDGVGHLFFGRDPSEVKPPQASTIDLWELTSHQQELLQNDAEIDPDSERERCSRYNFNYDGRTTRRRIFWGGALSDESPELLQAVGTEAYGIYHTAAFVESNSTQSLNPREWRFPPENSDLKKLIRMFGPTTKVTMDYFIDGDAPIDITADGLGRASLQRQGILMRWKKNGMKPDDVGILSDSDEVFTRDFLRAMQICDIPEFRAGQDCKRPKIQATGLPFESSPECIVDNFLMWHGDALIGECIDIIGNRELHPPPKRVWKGRHSFRSNGHGRDGSNYDEYFASVNTEHKNNYPLWNAIDIRTVQGGRQIRMDKHKMHHTGFHFHNFFVSTDEIRFKYATYGEPLGKARTAPLGWIHDDLSVAVSCAHGWQNLGQMKFLLGGYDGMVGPRPVFFENEEFRKQRHSHVRRIILKDEEVFGMKNGTCKSATCQGCKGKESCT